MKSSERSNFWMFAAWSVAVIATAGSLYLSEVMKFQPCNLCWVQRIFMYPLALLLGIAYSRKERVIAIYALPLACLGLLVSAYHTWIQKFPQHAGNLAACGPVPCTGDYLNWFGFITIPMLALTAFILIIVSLIAVLRHNRS
ncbi:disulfide bond formation protein B [Paenibacillus sp. IB182496]|uniref:Disulfide bond formation protein B n=1 Tax=Paenibacillus sabuli TaxID=2772509 RepID=A0A927BY34_9BACL|nr:disulfide oxidoreductase [Paenibacillus sabuli]MBD2847735.1 disulfide bond formation protein B [Paenibacillus sabuli]